jgi:hypothetical protein
MTIREKLLEHKEHYEMLIKLSKKTHIYRITDDNKKVRISFKEVVRTECEAAIADINTVIENISK